MTYANIPDELKRLTQWVVWKYHTTDTGKQTKLPYNARTGYLASHSDPLTWSTFDEAVNATWQGFDGIGFVFTARDEYCGIDLDEADGEDLQRQYRVYEAMASYSELSPSGNGLHIIVKARVPHGRKRASIEIYSSERYFTFTGNVYGNPAPIMERQELVTRLWEEMGPAAQPEYYAGDDTPKAFDKEIFEMAKNAVNGEKFMQLWNGYWQQDYPSQSDADMALMNMIVFYTKNRAQAIRLFRMSALGQRDKAKRLKYLEYTIDKAFDQTLPPVDVSALIDNINAAIAANRQTPAIEQQATSGPAGNGAFDLTPARDNSGIDYDLWRTMDPPGVLNDAMHFIMSAAPRPVREIALTASLGLLSGICGRAFNVSNTGLNLYLMMLAETGRGKEAMASGINRLMSQVAGNDAPAVWSFLGPSNMASGSGLLKHLAEASPPSFVSLTGEIGLRLQQMASPNANVAEHTLQTVLLDLYAKSGYGQVVRPTVYSDKKNNIEPINAPAFTWLGESTPSEFYKALNERQIESGLLPRFVMVEYNGPRPPMNEGHDRAFPGHKLVSTMREICETALKANQSNQVIAVGMTAGARELSRMIDLYCDHKINAINAGPLVQLWNRTHLNVLKVAALLAVAHNWHAPTIDEQMLRWANSLVMTNTRALSDKFERGEIGKSVAMEGASVLCRGMVDLMEGRRKLSPTDAALAQQGVVSRSAMVMMTAAYKVFKEDKRLFGELLAEIEKQGALLKLSKSDALTMFNSRAELYQVVNAQWFYDNLK